MVPVMGTVAQDQSKQKLRARIGRGDGFTAVRLDGILDEHNGLAQLTTALGAGEHLLIDLGGVKRINSVGVRDWVLWLRALRGRWKELTLFDCPPPVMNEVNFVKNFAEGARITTFGAPLFCGLCQKEETRVLDAYALKAAPRRELPSFACGKSGCQNALDDDEEGYLGFLAGLPEVAEPEKLRAMTDAARALFLPGGSATPLSPLTNEAASPPAEGGAAQRAPLGQLGQIGQAAHAGTSSGVRAAAPPAAAPAAAVPAEVPRGDWLFLAAMVAMVAVLGVLVYLIMTLE